MFFFLYLKIIFLYINRTLQNMSQKLKIPSL